MMTRLQEALGKLTTIGSGDLRRIVTRERLQAIQDVLAMLADGENLTTSGGIRKSKGLGTGRVRLDLLRDKDKPTRKAVPLHLLTSRPAYIPMPVTPPSEGTKRIWIEWGTLNDQIATNWDDHHDITETTYFFAKATLRTTDTLRVESWEIVTGPEWNSHATADWAVGAARPSHAVVQLGVVWFTDGQFNSVMNSGGGSLSLTEHISLIQGGSTAGETLFGKQLLFQRQNY